MRTFSQQQRLKKNHEFRRVYSKGQKFFGQFISISIYPSTLSNLTKLGVTLSKKYGSSVQRNLFKRRAREVFRLLQETFPKGSHWVIQPKGAKLQPSYSEIKDDVLWALDQLKIESSELLSLLSQ